MGWLRIALRLQAGLGRTGTRQAIGWLRIARPGSVIGPQQHYLCDSEPVIRAAGEAFRRLGGPAVRVAGDAAVAEVSAFIAAAAAAAAAAANARAAALATGVGRCTRW